MPIYEFRCGKCETKFEELMSAGSNSVTCPECGCGEVKKLFSGFATKSGEKFTSDASGCSSCSKPSCTSCKP